MKNSFLPICLTVIGSFVLAPAIARSANDPPLGIEEQMRILDDKLWKMINEEAKQRETVDDLEWLIRLYDELLDDAVEIGMNQKEYMELYGDGLRERAEWYERLRAAQQRLRNLEQASDEDRQANGLLERAGDQKCSGPERTR